MWSWGLCERARWLLVMVSVSRGQRGVSRIADCTELHITFGGSEVFEPLDDVFAGVPTAFTFWAGNGRCAPLDQLVAERLVRRDRREGAFLAQHHEQVRQAPAGRFFSPAHRPAVTATPRQMTGEEVRDDPLIANPVASQLFVQVPAEVNDSVPVVPARPLGIARARAASGSAEWPPVRAGPPPSARRTARSRTLRASPTSITCV